MLYITASSSSKHVETAVEGPGEEAERPSRKESWQAIEGRSSGTCLVGKGVSWKMFSGKQEEVTLGGIKRFEVRKERERKRQ